MTRGITYFILLTVNHIFDDYNWAPSMGSWSMLSSARGSTTFVVTFPDGYVGKGYGREVALGSIPLRGAIMPLGFES